MGTKSRSFAPLPRDVSLEDLVPKDHSYRRLEATLDLSFVRDLVAPLYRTAAAAAGWFARNYDPQNVGDWAAYTLLCGSPQSGRMEQFADQVPESM